jgi:RNA polymerase sigma-70 factor (ECF subfamily)
MLLVPPAADPLTPEFVAAFRGGDERAFEALFRDWYGRLADYASRLVGNADAAEDDVQDVFVALWRRRESIPEADKLPAYLFRAVRNRALNQIRNTDAAARLAVNAEDEEPMSAPADAGVLHAEVAGAIAAAVNDLAPRTREIFLMSRDQGLTYAQISDALDISVKTVETLMGRALRALRTRLKPHVTGGT